MSLTGTIADGPLLFALAIAALAGLVSFLSPCVLPLVPGYLSYVTGLSGADLAGEAEEGAQRVRGRVVLGAVLFVLGFSAVFVSAGALFGGLGSQLALHQRTVDIVLGLITILLGLVFVGLIPGMQRELRLHVMPRAGLAGAPLLGVVFGVGWTPCLGPTLGAVQTLAFNEASAARGAFLTVGYCIGLGLPFILTALAMRRALGAFDVVKRHYQVVLRIGGGLLVVVGLLLVSGLWQDLMIELRVLINGFTPAI